MREGKRTIAFATHLAPPEARFYSAGQGPDDAMWIVDTEGNDGLLAPVHTQR
jgi:hypothetical protein